MPIQGLPDCVVKVWFHDCEQFFVIRENTIFPFLTKAYENASNDLNPKKQILNSNKIKYFGENVMAHLKQNHSDIRKWVIVINHGCKLLVYTASGLQFDIFLIVKSGSRYNQNIPFVAYLWEWTLVLARNCPCRFSPKRGDWDWKTNEQIASAAFTEQNTTHERGTSLILINYHSVGFTIEWQVVATWLRKIALASSLYKLGKSQ